MLFVSLTGQLDAPRNKLASLLVSIMLQDQLLQPQECPLMRDLLSDLHTSLPCVLCCQSSTCGTLPGVDNERKDESLL